MEYIKEYSISSGLEGIHMQYMIEYIRNTCCNIIYLAGSKEYPLNTPHNASKYARNTRRVCHILRP